MTAPDRDVNRVVTALSRRRPPADRILAGDAHDEYTHDEALGATPVVPIAVLLPETAERGRRDPPRAATSTRIPSPRAEAAPVCPAPRSRCAGGVVVSFERMKRDRDRRPRTRSRSSSPGVTLAELDEVTRQARPRLSRLPRRVQRLPRRERRHERRWHAGREVRRDPPPGARPRGRARRAARSSAPAGAS